VLERQPAGLVEEGVDDDTLRRREDDRLDRLLVLVPSAVAPDELQPRTRERHVEHTGVRGVRQVEAHHLAAVRAQGKVRLAADEEDVAEPAHRRVRRLGRAEGRDRAVLDQHVVERQRELAVRRRPVVLRRRHDDDVPVEPELLAVILADVRVVPVDARIGELDPIRERPADGNRRLRLVRSVEAVVEPQPVPVDRSLEVPVVDDVHDELGAFADAQRRAGNRAVVREHAHRRVSDPLRDGPDPKVEGRARDELDDVRADGLGQIAGLGRKPLSGVLVYVLHRRPLLAAVSTQDRSVPASAFGRRDRRDRGRELCDLRRAVGRMPPVRPGRVDGEAGGLPPRASRADGPRLEAAAAVGAHVVELVLDARGAERALVATDPRVRGVGGQILVAQLAVRPELEHRDLACRMNGVTACRGRRAGGHPQEPPRQRHP
jgi:hypothetical protein